MISIFNGRVRGLGQSDNSGIYIQVQVALREHLCLFKGARLGVFLSIALHSDRDGWSHPSNLTICRETGYNRQTVSSAIGELTTLEIDAHRVMLAYQRTVEAGRFGRNRYLVFPSTEEVARYGGSAPRAPNLANSPTPGFPATVEPATVRPATVNSTHEGEPCLWDTHPEGKPTASSSSSPAQSPPAQPLDDDDALAFYSQVTGNPISPRDRAAYQQMVAPAPVWKEAIRLAGERAKVKIRSLGYCVPIVEELLAKEPRQKRVTRGISTGAAGFPWLNLVLDQIEAFGREHKDKAGMCEGLSELICSGSVLSESVARSKFDEIVNL